MTGKEFAERIDLILNKRNQTRKAITTDLNISSSTMSSWASSRGSIPNANIVAQIAEYLNVTTDWLITGKEQEGFECSQEEKKLLASLRVLDSRDKQLVAEIVGLMLDRAMTQQEQSKSASRPHGQIC